MIVYLNIVSSYETAISSFEWYFKLFLGQLVKKTWKL